MTPEYKKSRLSRRKDENDVVGIVHKHLPQVVVDVSVLELRTDIRHQHPIPMDVVGITLGLISHIAVNEFLEVSGGVRVDGGNDTNVLD